jgi:hypothetical protein
MKKALYLAFITGILGSSLSASSFDIGVSASDQGINGFSFSIGDYYRVPQREVMVIEQSIPRDEMSVVYFLARESNTDARYISDMRLRGGSWWDISLRLGLDPRTLYVMDGNRRDDRSHGYGRNHRLRDSEIIDIVNVRFLSDYHHISPDEVIKRRRGGEHYNNIDEHYRGENRQQYRDEQYHDENRQQYRDERHDENRNEDRSSNVREEVKFSKGSNEDKMQNAREDAKFSKVKEDPKFSKGSNEDKLENAREDEKWHGHN